MINKLCLILLTSGLALGAAQAQTLENVMINQGSRELLLEGNYESSGAVGQQVGLGIGFGYFMQDYIEVGGIFEIDDNDFTSTVGLKAFVEYNWDTLTNWVPIGGTRLGYTDFEADGGDSNSAAELTLYVGSKVFLNEYLAITATLNFNFASDEIYLEDGDPESFKTNIDLGVRVFY